MKAAPDCALIPACDTAWIDADYGGLFEQILRAQRAGYTCLPTHLGLSEADFMRLTALTPTLGEAARAAYDATGYQRGDLRQQLLDMRRDEWLDLVGLLLDYRCTQDDVVAWMAQMVAAACLGSEHLWRDLGMTSRSQLRYLLSLGFPDLVDLNDKDMRWKKFFYKQLCEREGSYVCRSPTCETCPTYHECFGDES